MIQAGLAIGVAIAVVLCIAVLVALALIGMKRYGGTLSNYLVNKAACGSGDEKQEMEWDHSALNITVNPLETECTYEDEECGLYGGDVPHPAVCTDKNEEQAEASDVDAEEEEEEEVEKDAAKCAVVKELEWDDSILSM
jgi:hypothetical protein